MNPNRPIACQEWEESMAEVLFEEASAETSDALHAHITACGDCRKVFESLRATLDGIPGKSPLLPDPEGIAALENRIMAAVSTVQALRPTRSPRSVSPTAGLYLAWGRMAAAAVVILAIGIVLGRGLREPAIPSEASSVAATNAVFADAEARAGHYLDRSKTLLLGVVNFDLATENPDALNLPQRTRIARELLQEADYLRHSLSDAEQRRLKTLVMDLEQILLQLAHLDASAGLPEIQLVQDGVDRNAVLFKIDLEKLRRSAAPATPAGSSNAL